MTTHERHDVSITSRSTSCSTSSLSKQTASVIIWLQCVKDHVVYVSNMFFQHFFEIRHVKSPSFLTHLLLETCMSSSNGGKYTRTQTDPKNQSPSGIVCEDTNLAHLIDLKLCLPLQNSFDDEMCTGMEQTADNQTISINQFPYQATTFVNSSQNALPTVVFLLPP